MAAGDYVVRRNNAETTEIPDAGSDLQLTWDTSVATKGSGITYSSGTFTLGETGHFLVLCSEQWGTTDTSTNERTNVQMELTLAGSVLSPVGYSTGYVRRSGGSQEFINFSAAVVEVTTTTGNGDDLEIRVERIDNSTAGTVNRIADRSGVTIIKLDDSWGYGRYQSSAAFTPSATDNARTTANIQTTDEQDSPFTRTTNTIDVATGNLVLAVYSFQNDDSDTLSGRTEMQGVLTLAGSEVAGSYSQTYGPRVTDNCNWGGMSCVCLLNPTSGDDVELVIISNEDADEDWFGAIQLVELPSGAEACIYEATTGDFNTAATDFTWDTNPYIDTGSFTGGATQANIDVDNDGDYLVMASQTDSTGEFGTAATRAVPAMQFRVNTTDDETAGSSTYHRNANKAEHGTLACATLLTGLSANDSIYVRNDRLGTVTTALACASGAFSAIRMSTLFPAGDTSIEVPVGSLSLTEQTPLLDLGIIEPVGSLAFNEQAPLLNLTIEVPAGSLGLSGQAPEKKEDHVTDDLPQGVVTLTGRVVSLNLSIRDPPVDTLQIAAQTPSLGLAIIPPAGALTTATLTPLLNIDYGVPSVSISLTGLAPTATVAAGDITAEPGAGSLSTSTLTPLLDIAYAIPAASLTLSGKTPDSLLPEPGNASLSFTGQQPYANVGPRILIPNIGRLEIVGRAPTLLLDSPIIVPFTGQLNLVGGRGLRLDGYQPTVLDETPAQTAEPGAGALSLSGLAPSVEIDHIREIPSATSLTLSGKVPTAGIASGPTTIFTEVGAATLTGQIPVTLRTQTVFGTSLGLIGQPPLVSVDSSDPETRVHPGVGSATLTGKQPERGVGLLFTTLAPQVLVEATPLNPGAGSLTLAGKVPEIGGSRTIEMPNPHEGSDPPTFDLTLTGYAPVSAIVAEPNAGQLTLTGLQLQPLAYSWVVHPTPGSISFSSKGGDSIGGVAIPIRGRSRRKRKPRFSIDVDGERFVVHTIQEAVALLNEAAELAEQTSESSPEAIQSAPKIRVLTRTGRQVRAKAVNEAALKAQRRINRAFDKARARLEKQRKIDREIALLMALKLKEEQDEEEALLALLL
jgi:hypothetical protein